MCATALGKICASYHAMNAVEEMNADLNVACKKKKKVNLMMR